MLTKTFEGPNFDATVAKARDAVGACQVVRAERVRSGGLGGFFSKEWIEVEVEFDPDVQADEVVTAENGPPSGWLSPPQRTTQDARQASGGVESDSPDNDAAVGGDGPTSLLDLANLVSDVEHTLAEVERSAPPEPNVSTQTQSFATVLAQILRDSSDTPAASTLPPNATTATESAPEAIPATSTATAAPFDPLERPLAAVFAEHDPPPPEGDPSAGLITPPRELNSTSIDGDSFAVAELRTPGLDSSPRLPASALGALGLPETLIRNVGDHADLRAGLIRALADLPFPPPLPCSGGTVMAIVGDRQDARAIVDALSVTNYGVVTVSNRSEPGSRPWEELSTLEAVVEQRMSWRRRRGVTLVVVDAVPDPWPAWTLEVLECLEPTLTWGVVEATRKVEDLGAWVAGVGGLDALAVIDVASTTTPAALLELGLPVVLLDGQPATAEHWTDLLLDRLER